MLHAIAFIAVGLLAGITSGLVGIGGGIIVIPALIYLFGFSQHIAQGTTLAMLVPPIGILAALSYYRQGHVNMGVAGLLCLGFVFGGLLGAKFAIGVSPFILRKIFGTFLLVVAVHMIVK